MEKQEREVLQKYGVSEEQLKKEFERLDIGKICDVNCLLAMCDLVLNGDIVKTEV